MGKHNIKKTENCVIVGIKTEHLISMDDIINKKVSENLESALNYSRELDSFACECKNHYWMFMFDNPYKAIEFYNWSINQYDGTLIETRYCNNINNIKGYDA